MNHRVSTHFAISSLLLSLAMASTATASELEDYDRCADLEEDAISLTQLWQSSIDVEPGYDAAEQERLAEQAHRRSIDRERYPGVDIHAEGDGGKRVSPGAERDQGVSARANMGATLDWLLYDSARQPRRSEADLRVQQQQAASEAFDAEHRARISRAYTEAAYEEARHHLLQQQAQELDELADIVERRIDAGVEGEYEARILAEAIAGIERQVAEARRNRQASIVELSATVGQCATPARKAFDVPIDDTTSPGLAIPDDSPTLRSLRLQAQTMDAASELSEADGRLQIFGVGSTSMYLSPAYDNLPEPEYFAGVAGRFRPDLRGSRSQRAQSESYRARALELEAQSLQRQLHRHHQQLRREQDDLSQRLDELDVHLERTEERVDITYRRWEQGVEQWIDVVDARSDRQELLLERMELHREVTHSMIDYAELSGDFQPFRQWMQQFETP